jgi:hypothetical protein
LIVMTRALTLAAVMFAVVPAPASAQTQAVLHIKITLTDAARASVPVAGHALLISDNPATRPPRRIVTAADGTANVTLRPGNYTVESDEPFAFNGKGYQWTQTLDVRSADVVLDLNAANAEVVAAPGASSSSSTPPKVKDVDSLITVWTPESRDSGFLVDAAGLVVSSQSVIGSATAVEVQLSPAIKVAARVLAADRAKDVAVLWIDPGAIASAKQAPRACADVPVDGACEAVVAAKAAMQTTLRPAATLLPVEPLEPFPAGVLDAAVQRRVGNLSPYAMSSADFDIAFLTPVQVHAELQGRQTALTGFDTWSDYFSSGPRVLVVRVTPKMTESFLTKLARGAA